MALRVEFGRRKEKEPKTEGLSLKEAQGIMDSRIAEVARAVARPFPTVWHRGHTLFRTDQDGALVYSQEEALRVADGEKLQEAGLNVMGKYGMDPESSVLVWETPNPNGISIEQRLFPSATVEGLCFEKWTDRNPETGEEISSYWRVRDKAPILKPKASE